MLLFLLALAVGVVVGALALNFARTKSQSSFVRFCAAFAGAVVGYVGTYIVVAHL